MSIMEDHPDAVSCEHCSQTAKRVYGFVVADAALKRDRKFGHFSDALPTNCPGANEYDGEGRPRIESRKHAHEIAAQNGYHFV